MNSKTLIANHWGTIQVEPQYLFLLIMLHLVPNVGSFYSLIFGQALFIEMQMKHHYRSSPRWVDNAPPKEPWISKEKFHWQVQDEFLVREAPEALKTTQATAVA